MLVVYTVFSGYQAYYARQQATSANIAAQDATESLNTIKNQFQLDQRPYIIVAGYVVSVARSTKPSPPRRGKPVAVDILFKNVGKSPATNAVARRHILFGSKVLGDVRIDLPDHGQYIGVPIDAGQPYTTTALSISDTYVNQTARISPSELVNWDGTEIFVIGRIAYEDAFGKLYCTPYAAMLLESGSWLRLAVVGDHKLTDLCPEGKY